MERFKELQWTADDPLDATPDCCPCQLSSANFGIIRRHRRLTRTRHMKVVKSLSQTNTCCLDITYTRLTTTRPLHWSIAYGTTLVVLTTLMTLFADIVDSNIAVSKSRRQPTGVDTELPTFIGPTMSSAATSAHKEERNDEGNDAARASRAPRSGGSSVGGSPSAGIPCVYEGHIETDRNWYGYLANVSVRTTGQLSFEFAYPAHMCCQNVLFYLEDQVAVISPRMNCWQKEYLLRPEDDQILRLTPSFSWSGCHVTSGAYDDGVDTFVCKGGRSFSVESSSSDRLTTWYIAISNCASQLGIDLYYHLEIYGHIGNCVRPNGKSSSSFTGGSTSNLREHGQTNVGGTGGGNGGGGAGNPAQPPKASLTPREASGNKGQLDDAAGAGAGAGSGAGAGAGAGTAKDRLCVMQGNISSMNTWYGFVRNISLAPGGGYRYQFSYPQHLVKQNIILYSEEDIQQLDWELTCWQKERIIGQDQYGEQVLEMHKQASWNGCVAPSSSSTVSENGSISSSTSTLTPTSEHHHNQQHHLTCSGERRYDTSRKIFIALSNCRSNHGVQLQYRLEVFGSAPDNVCSTATVNWRTLGQLTTTIFVGLLSTFALIISRTYWTGRVVCMEGKDICCSNKTRTSCSVNKNGWGGILYCEEIATEGCCLKSRMPKIDITRRRRRRTRDSSQYILVDR